MQLVKNITATQLKTLPEFRVGDTVKVHQRIKEGAKERVQIFEGLVIARKGGKERIYPLHSPNIVKLEVTKPGAVSRAKLYYVRERLDSQPRFRKSKAKK